MKKLFDGQFSKTLNEIQEGEFADLGLSRFPIGVCTYRTDNWVQFNNVKRNNTKGTYIHCFIKNGLYGWEDVHKHIEWKRG